MNIKQGYKLKTIAGENVVINVGAVTADFRRVNRLNDTAAFMWRQIAEGRTPGETAALVAEKYSIDPAKARQDVDGFVARLVDSGLAEE